MQNKTQNYEIVLKNKNIETGKVWDFCFLCNRF